MNHLSNVTDEWKIAGNEEVLGMPTEDKGLIITGLGGKNKHLRYFVVVPAFKDTQLKNGFKTEVNKNFNSLFTSKKAEIEKITIKSDHIRLVLLIHIDYSVEEIVMALIKKSNEDKKLLFTHYFVTNTAILGELEIRKYVDEVREKLNDRILARTAKVLNVTNPDQLPTVTNKTLVDYYQYLSKHMVFPAKAKKDNGGEITILGLSDAENIDEFYGLFCIGRANKKPVEFPLSEIQVIRKDNNRTLINDYLTWFWNYR